MNLTQAEKQELSSLSSQMDELSLEQQKILDEIRPLQDKAMKLGEEKNKILPILQKLKTKEILNSDTKDWEALLDNDNSSTYQALQQLFPFGSSLAFNGAYWLNSNQRVLTIKLYKNHPEDDTPLFQQIMDILPHYKPVEDGKVCFKISEHELSAYGSYNLFINPAQPFETEIVITQHGRKSVVKSFPQLEQAIPFIRERLWYEENK